jgi:hypothetical protein
MQLDALRARVNDNLARVAEALRADGVPEPRLELRRVAAGSLGQFAECGICDEDDLIAGAMMRFGGRLSGSALFVLEPEDALDWVGGRTSEGDPIHRFLDLSGQLMMRLVEAIAEDLRCPIEFSAASLEENSVLVALLGTHAPPDTVLLSLRLQLTTRGLDAPADLHVLMERKPLECLLAESTAGLSPAAG